MKNLMAALLKVQAEVRGVKKDAVNPHFKSRYADLDAILDATREVLVKAELVIAQTGSIENEGDFVLVTELFHVPSGECLRSHFPVICEKMTPQAVGSSLTYMRRYAQLAILNLSQCDDDGETASTPPPQPKKQASGALLPKAGAVNNGAPMHIDVSPERLEALRHANQMGFHSPESHAQGIKLFWATARGCGWTEEDVKDYIEGQYDIDSTKSLEQHQLSNCLKYFEANPCKPKEKK